MKKKDIIQLVKKLVKEDAYGSATLTTQGSPRTGTVVPTDEYPFSARPKRTATGMMEDESTSFKVVNADTGKTIDFGLDQAKAEEIVALAKEDNINAKIVKMKDADDVGKLNEFTSMGQEGIYPRKEEPGDMFQQKEVEELLPNGMASRDDRAFQDRLKQHADWTEESGYNNTFVHIQYHDSFDREHSYRIHQSQNYNGNYDDFRNPKFTVLTITKKKEGKEEELGRYIVDTDAYLKDFAKLRNDGVLGKQVSENKEIDEIKVNYDFSEKELVRILKQLKRGASTEVDMIRAFEKSLGREITDKELFKEAPKGGTQSSQFEGIDEEEVHGKEIVITAGSLQNALTFIGKNLKKLSNSMLSRLLEILKLSSISDFPYNVKDLKPKLKQMTPEEAKTFGLELNKFHTDMKRKNIKQEAKTVIDPMAPLGGAATMSKQNIKMPTATHAIKLAKKTQEPVTIISPDVNEEEAPGTSMNNADIGILNDLVQLYRPEKLKATIDILAKGTTLTSKFPKKYEEMDINEMINDYIKERGDDNLMEHTRKYHKKAQLREERMEKATEKLFALFNQGKTDAEVRSIYLTKNIDMPDSFISKLRNNWESLRKTKLDLTLADKEAEGFQQIQQPKAIAGMEPGMEDGDVGMEEDKQLASGLFNETK